MASEFSKTERSVGGRLRVAQGQQHAFRVFRSAHSLQVGLSGRRIHFSKIRYDLNELPDSAIQQLFTMLLEAAKQLKNSTTSVRNEICLVIATLLIRWTGVTDIVNVAVQNIGMSETDTMLLNVLSLLPIELQSRRVHPISDVNDV